MKRKKNSWISWTGASPLDVVKCDKKDENSQAEVVTKKQKQNKTKTKTKKEKK